jgi:hypothetical protein
MMKISQKVLVSLFFLVSACKTSQVKTKDTNVVGATKPTTELWQDSERFTSVKISINERNQATLEFTFFEAGAKYSGLVRRLQDNYEFINLKQIYQGGELAGTERYLPTKMRCRVIEDPSNPLYMRTMEFKNFRLYSLHERVPIGSKRIAPNAQYVTIEPLKGEPATNVVLRLNPSVTASRKKLTISKSTVEPAVFLNYMPKGYSIRAIARTEEKVNVDQVSDYWYLIEYVNMVPLGADARPDGFFLESMEQAWVFGHYLKF